ncbi:MAG: hypothetical protein HC873_12035 [Leptolyngbyaceae cyanobacterium SL_1_1]|nr:hypothetical protein [Leptolyngbyaceae cyanobacterium RM1_1_2]NJO10259.1 hypothetical protein [Leptolyngbyaceae cyanobacterium SL_1_1]
MTSTFTPQERLASLQVGAIAGLSTLLTAVLLLLAHRAIATGWPAAVAINLSGLSGLTFVVSSLIAGLSGFLFGVTYRYAVRSDANFQLKAGVISAFGLVRGLAQVDAGSAVAQNFWPFLTAALESLILFAIAGLLLDLGFRQGWLRPFG